MFVVSPFLIPITAIAGVFVFIIVKTLVRARVRELEIRERIAMIERGLLPAPEVDPRGFDRAMSRFERREYRREHRRGSGRHRRAGVTLMGVGFGLMVLIAFTSDEVSVAIGVGGFLVMIGIAFFINSLIDGDSRHDLRPTPPPSFGTSSGNPATPADSARRD
ncbi:MAG TPA: DUF6249 domain-containing protein [Vicinamibacterales bacterium]|nr:DUF6249 domain-containing protein [Vicinamibacterales bacterium]